MITVIKNIVCYAADDDDYDDANNSDKRNIRTDLSSVIRKMYLLIYSVQQCLSSEANWFSTGQDVPRIL
jgi:hypothetical protein